MKSQEVRRRILDYLYNNRNGVIESKQLSEALEIEEEIINRELPYLIEKGYVNKKVGFTGGGYAVNIHADGIDIVEGFANINDIIKKHNPPSNETDEVISLNSELEDEILKPHPNKDVIGKILEKLKEYAWVNEYIPTIVMLLKSLGII